MIVVMMAAVVLLCVPLGTVDAQSGGLCFVVPAKQWPLNQTSDVIMNCSAEQVIRHKRRVPIQSQKKGASSSSLAGWLWPDGHQDNDTPANNGESASASASAGCGGGGGSEVTGTSDSGYVYGHGYGHGRRRGHDTVSGQTALLDAWLPFSANSTHSNAHHTRMLIRTPFFPFLDILGKLQFWRRDQDSSTSASTSTSNS